MTPCSLVIDSDTDRSDNTTPPIRKLGNSSIEIGPFRKPLKRASCDISSYSLNELAESAQSNDFDEDKRDKIMTALDILNQLYSKKKCNKSVNISNTDLND
ncbi:unnamed protein product [Brachionus calyciflorus]|uniref:Uncharacterized protein n=1 Tax=Brachionus calyciflorus TaxID=104777 RepID=A0A814MU70_9BILA|nr:unnamed protein product [Brachionus calyciflorus]